MENRTVKIQTITTACLVACLLKKQKNERNWIKVKGQVVTLVMYHAMKTNEEVEVSIHALLISAVDGGEALRLLYPRGKSQWYRLDRRALEPGLESVLANKKSLSPAYCRESETS
jgi:hypothetical protein